MEVSKKGLNEFKSLMSDSKKDWERNKKRFSDKEVNQTMKTVFDPVADPEPDSDKFTRKLNLGRASDSIEVEVQDDLNHTEAFQKEKRKRQIDLGHMILGYFKEEAAPSKISEREKAGPGRPRKEKSDQVRVIAIKIRPEYVEFLKGLSFGRGMGTRIRMIIDDWNRFKKREKEQVRVLKKALGELDRALKRYAKNYERAENFERNEDTLKDLGRACGNIKIFMNLLKFEMGDLRGLLTKEELRNLDFSYNFRKEI